MREYPSYLSAFKSGQLKDTADRLFESLGSCAICPRKCRVNRLEGKLGYCNTGKLAKVYSFFCHRGEEPAISGTRGSGTIFFSHCNMRCVYCQNYEFSQDGAGREYTCEELAQAMLQLQESGCHNINFVTPTHVLPQILRALQPACEAGLRIPLVYNTSGYELSETIKLLDGIIDIYLPDMRYAEEEVSARLSQAADYPQHNRDSVKEMYRQVGTAELDEEGLIRRGLIIRHLVLPNLLAGTEKTMQFITREISGDTYVSLMSQYLPYYKAGGLPEINRRLRKEEYEDAKRILKELGLLNGWIQESYGCERFAGVNIKPV